MLNQLRLRDFSLFAGVCRSSLFKEPLLDEVSEALEDDALFTELLFGVHFAA
jgi:hypothetical protein